jgi:hypothetical protein
MLGRMPSSEPKPPTRLGLTALRRFLQTWRRESRMPLQWSPLLGDQLVALWAWPKFIAVWAWGAEQENAGTFFHFAHSSESFPGITMHSVCLQYALSRNLKAGLKRRCSN